MTNRTFQTGVQGSPENFFYKQNLRGQFLFKIQNEKDMFTALTG